MQIAMLACKAAQYEGVVSVDPLSTTQISKDCAEIFKTEFMHLDM